MAHKRFEKSTTAADDHPAGRPADHSEDYSGAGLGRPPPPQRQQKPLGLRERKKRRRKRQQRSRQKQLLRPDFLGNDHGNGGDDHDGGSNDGDVGDDDDTGAGRPPREHSPAATTACAPATTDPYAPVGQTGYGNGNNDNDRYNSMADGTKGEERDRATLASSTEDHKAQQKSLGAESGEGGVDKPRREVYFKPVARQRNQTNVPRKRGSSSGVNTSDSRTEENANKVIGRGRGVEHPRAGGAGARGNEGVEDRGKGFESRAAAAGESRVRRTRRKKSQEIKKRGGGGASCGGGGSGGAVVPGRGDNGAVGLSVRAYEVELGNVLELCMPHRHPPKHMFVKNPLSLADAG